MKKLPILVAGFLLTASLAACNGNGGSSAAPTSAPASTSAEAPTSADPTTSEVSTDPTTEESSETSATSETSEEPVTSETSATSDTSATSESTDTSSVAPVVRTAEEVMVDYCSAMFGEEPQKGVHYMEDGQGGFYTVVSFGAQTESDQMLLTGAYTAAMKAPSYLTQLSDLELGYWDQAQTVKGAFVSFGDLDNLIELDIGSRFSGTTLLAQVNVYQVSLG